VSKVWTINLGHDYLPLDTDPATVAEVKAVFDLAMQVEIKSEKPDWYLGRVLSVAIL
jgi:hypothetical protein